MNGQFFQLDENGKIAMNGSEGYGALCQREYKHDRAFTLGIESCKYDVTSSAIKIFYYKNGLPRYKVCCKTDSSNVETYDSTIVADSLPAYETDTLPIYSEEESPYLFFKKNDQPWHYTDTTWFIYDAKWRIKGIKTKWTGFTDIFGKKESFADQWYINNTRFEIFIDKKIGYRPKHLLLEIYRNAVFSFRYDERRKKYFYNGDIELE
jgi:hypothetical protein